MKSHSERKIPKEITDAAVEWLLEEQEGFKQVRAAQFQDWLRADPRHVRAMEKAERTLALLGELPQLKDSVSDRFSEEPGPELSASSGHRWGRLVAWVGVAATLAIASVAVTKWRVSSRSDPEFSYLSNNDRPQQVVLTDGSFIDLNVRTTIRTELMPHERRVALQEGEAHFAVAHDADRPFIVEAAGVSVRAVGTAFNVKITEERVEVLVTEGKVEITETRPGTNAPAATRPQLGAGDRALISRTSTSPSLIVEKIGDSELLASRSWHSQITNISNRPLREVIELFNRRNKLHLVIDDAELAGRNVGGYFALDQPRNFVRSLEIEGSVVLEPHGEDEIVLRRKR